MTSSEQNATKVETPVEVAQRRLRGSSYRSLRQLTCSFHQGVLTIGGRLPSFHLKQVAQNAVMGIEGVDRVDNQVAIAE